MRVVPIPADYRMTAAGIEPTFHRLLLDLHDDGRVTWRQVNDDGEVIDGIDPRGLREHRICKPCNGKGWAWDQSEQIPCPDCDGTGRERE